MWRRGKMTTGPASPSSVIAATRPVAVDKRDCPCDFCDSKRQAGAVKKRQARTGQKRPASANTKIFKQQFQQLCDLSEDRKMIAKNMELLGEDMQVRRLGNAAASKFVTAYMDECTTHNHSHSLSAGSWVDPDTVEFRCQMWDAIRLSEKQTGKYLFTKFKEVVKDPGPYASTCGNRGGRTEKNGVSPSTPPFPESPFCSRCLPLCPSASL